VEKNIYRLLKGSSVNVFAKMFGTLFGFVASFLILKSYGTEFVGIIAVITSAYSLLAIVCLFGNQTLVLKIIPQHAEKYGFASIVLIYRRVIHVTILLVTIGLAVWLAIELNFTISILGEMQNYFSLVAILVVFAVFTRINLATMRGLGDYKKYSLYETMPSFLLVIITLFCIAAQIPERVFFYCYFLPTAGLSIYSFFLVRNVLDERKNNENYSISEKMVIPSGASMLYAAMPMFGVTMSNALIAHFDVLMLNHYTNNETVGTYSIYAKITAASLLVTHSINSMLAPTIASLHTKEKSKELRSYVKKSTLIAFCSTVGLTGCILLVHRPLLAYFGDVFMENVNAFYIMLASSIITSFFGSVGFFLNMTGQQISFFRIMILASGVNILLNVLLIPVWGILGAAISTAICVLFWNVAATLKIYKINSYTLIYS